MKPPQVFGVIVRSIGLYLMIWGLWNLASLMVESLALVAAVFNDEPMDLLTKLYYLISGLGALLLGLILLARADAISRWAYRHDPPEPTSGTGETPADSLPPSGSSDPPSQ